MSRSSQAGFPAPAFGHLPTLQQAFACCNQHALVRIIMSEHLMPFLGGESVPRKRKHAARRRVKASLAAMQGVSARPPDGAFVLLPVERFVVHMGAHACTMRRRIDMGLGAPDFCCVPSASLAQPSAAGSPGGAPAGFGLAPWEESLGTGVWLQGPWCCRERYMALAAAFWELTRYGFSYEEACAGQAQARASQAGVLPAVGPGGLAVGARSTAWEGPLPAGGQQQESLSDRLGLSIPDAFEEAYCERVVARAECLNGAAWEDFQQRYRQALQAVNEARRR